MMRASVRCAVACVGVAVFVLSYSLGRAACNCDYVCHENYCHAFVHFVGNDLIATCRYYEKPQAFDEYLAKGAKAYLSRKLYGPVEATELMRSAGVVPVLAHPFTLNLRNEELERFVDELVAAGLRGIEGYHGDLSVDDQQPYRELGRARGLVLSGGSDYHGHMRPDRPLGGGRHGVEVPVELLEELRSEASNLQGAR
jgi:hypothetical protein